MYYLILLRSVIITSLLVVVGSSTTLSAESKPVVCDKKILLGQSSLKPTSSEDRMKSVPDAPRVVSLAPSNTELIYSLRAQDRLVGVSNYCLYPPETKSKQKVGSFVSINWEKITTLKPSVVVLVSGQEALEIQLKKHKIKALVLKNESLDDIANNLITLGAICACDARAKQMAELYRLAIKELNTIFKDSSKSKVFFCVWPKPIVTVGGASFLNDVINVCGGSNVVSNMKGSYPKCGPEKVIALQPDVLIMPYESKSIKLVTTPPWSLLSAPRKNQVYFLPDREHDYLSRPTLRILKGLFPLALKLHPEKKAELTKWSSRFTTEVN